MLIMKSRNEVLEFLSQIWNNRTFAMNRKGYVVNILFLSMVKSHAINFRNFENYSRRERTYIIL